MATRDGGGIALVNLEGKKPCKRTRRRFATKTEREIAAKGRKKRTDKTRITLGENYDEWERQRILCGGMANADFVVHLLASHETTCPSFLHVKARLQANTDRFVTYFTLYIIMAMFHLTGLNYFRHVPSFLILPCRLKANSVIVFIQSFHISTCKIKHRLLMQKIDF